MVDTETYLRRIYPNVQVVTAIELLSPVNKCKGSGRDAYERKQKEYLDAGVNLVEIDLIHQASFVVAIPGRRQAKADLREERLTSQPRLSILVRGKCEFK